MATSPMPVPQQAPAGGQQGLGTTQTAPTPTPTAPQQAPAQTAQAPMPISPQQHIQQAAQKATAVLAKAGSSLPHVIAQPIQQQAKQENLRKKLVIDTVVNAHVQQTAAQDKLEKLKAAWQENHQHWERVNQLPDDDPTKHGQMGYLAHISAQIAGAVKATAQTIQQSQQTIQAVSADPKNKKTLSLAFGYDEKTANAPERTMAVSALQQHEQQIQQGAAQAAKAVPPVPQQQSGEPGGNINMNPGVEGSQPRIPALPGSAAQPPNVSQAQPVTWKDKLASVAKTVGQIALDLTGNEQVKEDIPGSRQQKEVVQAKALALQQAIAALKETGAKTDLEKAQAGAEIPLAEHQKEFGETLSEKERETTATEANTAEMHAATEAYRQATLDLNRAKFDAQQDPNSTQNKFKLAQLKISQERATAALAAAAQTQDGVQNLAQMVITHQVAPAQLPGFGQQRAKVLAIVNKMDPTFNAAAADIAYRYANNASTQNTLNYLESLTGPDNKSGNLGILIQMSDALPRGNYPPINRPEQWAKLQSGNPQIASYYAAITESADQIAKIMQGGGTGNATSDAKLRQASDLFDKGFNSEQMKSVASTMRELLANRKSALIGANPFLEQQFGSGAQGSTPQSGASKTDPAGLY